VKASRGRCGHGGGWPRRRREDRAARAIVEAALDETGCPWSSRLSRWLDALLALEERDA